MRLYPLALALICLPAIASAQPANDGGWKSAGLVRVPTLPHAPSNTQPQNAAALVRVPTITSNKPTFTRSGVYARPVRWTWTPAKTHHAAVLRCRAASNAGSGCLVATNTAGGGLVLTCAHLFSSRDRTASAIWTDGYRSSGRLLLVDRQYDVALFEVARVPPGAIATPLAAALPEHGTSVELTGYGGPTDNLRHFSGTVRTDATSLELQADAILLNGDSGGPVFNADGQVVGVNSGGRHKWPWGLRDWPAHWPARCAGLAAIHRAASRLATFTQWRICPPGGCLPAPRQQRQLQQPEHYPPQQQKPVAQSIDYDKLAQAVKAAGLLKPGPAGPAGPRGLPGIAGVSPQVDLNALADAVARQLPPITVRTVDDSGAVQDSEAVHLGGTLNLHHRIRK